MKGDFSHWKHDPQDNYTGVLQQQGRVLLDRDWNAQTQIDSHRSEQTARDVIGRKVAAVPADEPNGFQVTQVVVNTGPDGEPRVELLLRPGRLWADGIPVVLPGDADTVLRVADYFGPPIQDPPATVESLSAGDRDAVILEVSHEALNAFQKPTELLEPALGGLDTTERIHTRTAYRLFRLAEGQDCHSIASLLCDVPQNRGQLSVRLQPTTTIPGDCPVVAGGGYTGFEHFLYRIEIAQLPDGTAPHFKWSQFNGGLVGRGRLQTTPDRITITANRPAIVNSGINAFYAEIVQWNEERGHWEVTLGADVTLSNGELHISSVRYGSFSASTDTVFYRLWNGIRPVSDFDNPASPGELLDGIQLAFPPAAIANLMPDDYWTFSVRAGEISNPEILLDHAPPTGPHYHRVPLAELTWGAPSDPVTPPELEDCRKRFRPLANQKLCCTYHIGDGVRTFGDFNCLAEAAAHLPPEGGELCLMPGIHFANVTFTDQQNVRIHGCPDRSWLFPRQEQPGSPIIRFQGGRNLSVEDLQAVSFAGSCVQVESSENGPPQEICIQGTKMIARTNAIRVDEGEDVSIRENILHLWDTDEGGAVLSLRSEDTLLSRNRFIVRPGVGVPEDGGDQPDDDGRPNPTPEDPCATPEDLYGTLSTYPVWIATIWLVAVFGPPPQPYRAQGGVHLRGACSRLRVWENRIAGGASHGITLGGSLRHDAQPPEDDVDEDGNPVVPRITLGEESGFSVRTIEAGTGNPIGHVPIYLTEGPVSFADQTDAQGLLVSKHEPGDYRISAGPNYSIEQMDVGAPDEFNFRLYTLHLAPAQVDQSLAFLHDVEIDHNEISRMGLSGIGFTLLRGAEAEPVGESIVASLAQASSANDPAMLATMLLATLLAPRELVGTTNPIRHLRISQNSIYGNVLNPFTEAMRTASRRVSLGGITLPIVDGLSISENVIRENGPNAIDPASGIFVGHGDNIDICNNEIAGNGAVTDRQDYLDRRAEGLRSGIFVRFAGATAMANGSRKPALRVQDNRVDQPAGRAITAFAFGPVCCDGNAFNSELTGNWNFFDEAVGGALILNFGGMHRALNTPPQLSEAEVGSDMAGGQLYNRAPVFSLGADAFRDRAAAERTLPGGESLYNNNQIRLGADHTSYTSQLVASFDDLGFDGNQSSIFGQNLLLTNTILAARTIRATDSRFTEDLTFESQRMSVSLITYGGVANNTTHNQADHCILAFPNADADNMPTVSSPNQVLFPAGCGRLSEPAGFFGYLIGFIFAVQSRNAASLTEGQINAEVGSLAEQGNLSGQIAIQQVHGANAEINYIYQGENALLVQQYGHQDVRTMEVQGELQQRWDTLQSYRTEHELADIAFSERTRPRQADVVSGPEGRVVAGAYGGMQDLQVQHVDRRGNAIGPAVNTDANGYYRFALNQEEAAELQQRDDLFLRVSDPSGNEIRRTEDTVAFRESNRVNFSVEPPSLPPEAEIGGRPIYTRPTPASTTSTPLEDLKGIGRVRADRLRQAGIPDVEAFIRTPPARLIEVMGFDAGTIVDDNLKERLAAERARAESSSRRRNINRPIRRARNANDPLITRRDQPSPRPRR